ncbi:bromodomain-containing protein [Stemphylium lycopersici]|uniref:Bromodomain-containing protein n=1 Tax=Stemphylium lycopersici TaxID=183478 RepID=A0A364NB27_STELY|nr:bromodomain-containing protein [Stemphylium lycopersici]RAR14383.1 bromodomain-containing protein [Stemphylium lycopersici]
MTTSLSAYTNLESLLLFQCLHAYGVQPSVFARISDLLKKNPDVTTDRYFQAGRLSPDALRNFYLERLKRELEYEQGGDSDAQNADATNRAKRKRHSPSLPTVQESLQHQHLIPRLVTKLYASYRYEITEQIRSEEDRYERLQRDLESIDRGEWDDQLRERANGRTPASRSPTLPRKSPHLTQKPLQPNASPQPVQNGARGGPVIAPSPDPTQNGQPSPSQRKKHPSIDARRTPSTPQPQPHPTPPPPPRAQPPQPHPAYNGAPYPNISPFPQGQTQPPSPAVPSPGPQFQHSPSQNYVGNGMPQYGPPGAHPPYHAPHQQFPLQQPGPHSPGLHSGQQQRPQYSHPGHQPYPPIQPQIPHPPPQAGFMLPPFQVAPQDPSRVHHQTTVAPQYPQTSTPVSNRQQPPRTNLQTPSAGRPGVPTVHPLVIQARQSLSTPTSARSPQSSLGTPVSAKSFWKRSSFNASPATPASPRPEVEPLDDVPPLIRTKQSPAKPKSQRKSRAKGKGKEAEQESVAEAEIPQNPKQSNDHEEESLLEPETRSGRSRRKASAKKTRPGSIASSRAGGSVRDRSRSQSILSHTDTVAADNESQAGHKIKSERGTSVDAMEEEGAAETPSHMSTRRRGAAPTSSLSTRRKRNAREASLEETEDRSFSTPGPPKALVAPRNFARMTAPMMYDINSHKHASTFNTAVRAKDAEGYYDIIKRPTDLTSIKKAIATGSKQVAAAAAASDNPTGSPGGATGGVVELPITVDNVPPKSIVNAAQLEKELMRMFVNAVMFNPGEEGVVNDARDMFQTVQGLVSTWRDVERDSGKGGNEGTPAAEDEDLPTASKRRKL